MVGPHWLDGLRDVPDSPPTSRLHGLGSRRGQWPQGWPGGTPVELMLVFGLVAIVLVVSALAAGLVERAPLSSR